MADITTFPTIHDVLHNSGNLFTFTVGTGGVKAGQVVAFSASGASMTVVASVAESGGRPIGVALYDAAAGGVVAVAMAGSICTVANADGSTGIDAGNLVETNDCAVGGTVSEVSESASGSALVITHPQVVGMALEDIAGGGTGKILVLCPNYAVQANSS